uniref:NAD(P)(+)--arginine ADP-ribosyltransferase n=1 Tax=Cyanoderma ruficeps TaxID=181631 RepID=A0A8C3QN51_9PASS
MVPLAHTLALLAITVATAAIEEFHLNMCETSFDDQYRGCGPNMTEALPALNRSDFQNNPFFAQIWAKATEKWQMRGSRVSPLASPDQAIAIMAYTMLDVYKDFNNAVQVAGRSPQEYWDNFHFKTFHFLLTQALVTLRDIRGPQCHNVFRGVRRYLFKAQTGDTVRFGRFTSTSLTKETALCFGTNMAFHVHTCHGVDIRDFSMHPWEEEVLIPPFETFKVTNITHDGKRPWIELQSTGTSSKYNCEWLKGGAIPSAACHLGGLLLATTALALATSII